MKVSICISAFNKPMLLKNTLISIYRQSPPFDYEVIVVDDGSVNGHIRSICSKFRGLRYHRIDRDPVFRNPCIARNTAYRMATGEVLICQSDEVLHITPNTIELLVSELKPETFVLANVFCLNQRNKICGEFTGPGRQAPYFFLGSVFREDLYAVGGNDEEFQICPAYEDAWFGDCLINGRGLTPVYTTKVIGHHQWHTYVSKPEAEGPSRELYQKKVTEAKAGIIPWTSTGGPWPFTRPNGEVVIADKTKKVFTDIYQSNCWGSKESKSGAGSAVDSTRFVRAGLERIIKQYNIKSILDIPCGDFNWMRHTDLQGTKYIGCDIVEELVESNRSKYPETKFECLDVITSKLPQADLIFCRDCLGHLAHREVKAALLNMSRSGATWLMTTTFPNHKQNKSIRTGQWTTINLETPPFSLPPPTDLANEDCQELYPHFNDKSLGLWRMQDIEPFNSIVVCVDLDDFLAITLPRNKKHFKRTLVVTASHDLRTQELCKAEGVECYVTDVFYANGAAFNKGAAMEEGFEVLGRKGWICIWDADIIMPDSIRQPLDLNGLHTPARKILPDPKAFSDSLDWNTLSSPTKPHEFDGYFQLFHAESVKAPWYSIDWSHAGGCDSDFQFKFPGEHKHRSPFFVLHLGDEGAPGIAARIGRNWRGRTSPRIDNGEMPKEADSRLQSLRKMVEIRKARGTGPEKINPPILNIAKGLPKRMVFFWAGDMSWLRLMTIQSFRHYNPDWSIELCSPTNLASVRRWRTKEEDDQQSYEGKDYSHLLDDLRVSRVSWDCPIPSASPAQASDLFQWKMLGTETGFYADMDILWTAPFEPVRQSVSDADAVLCLENGVMAIGLFGSNKFEFFEELYRLGCKFDNARTYQAFGTELILSLFDTPSSSVAKGTSGVQVLNKLRACYPRAKILEVPSPTVYPFDWRQIDQIFLQVHSLPSGTCGIHWFGGSKIAQYWNNLLQPETWRKYSSTITEALKRIFI